MDIFVATFENSAGIGTVQVFKTRKEANAFLRTLHEASFPDKDVSFHDWQTYGGFTCKVWKRKI